MNTPVRFEVRIRSFDGLTYVLSVAGELDALTAAVLIGTADAVPGDRGLEIDAAELTFCDGAGLRALISIARSRCHGPLVVHDARETVGRLLELIPPARPFVHAERTPVASRRS